MNNIWFTSDTHFDHKFMLKFRNFESVHEMNETLIENWNKNIKENDHVYHLGDFGFIPNKQVVVFNTRLNGNKYLIRGNHDGFGLSNNKSRGFSWIKSDHKIKIDNQYFILYHYPIRSWDKMYRGSIHLHGHCHYNIKDGYGKSMDVGVDNPACNYSPFHIDEILSIMKSRDILEVDHHNENKK